MWEAFLATNSAAVEKIKTRHCFRELSSFEPKPFSYRSHAKGTRWRVNASTHTNSHFWMRNSCEFDQFNEVLQLFISWWSVVPLQRSTRGIIFEPTPKPKILGYHPKTLCVRQRIICLLKLRFSAWKICSKELFFHSLHSYSVNGHAEEALWVVCLKLFSQYCPLYSN